MTVFSNPAFDNHERVLFCRDETTGLCAIIAIHSTALGPAAGGTRVWTYASDDDALYDVLRLSQGMSYKNAMAGLRFSGGKAVIMKAADYDASDALFERFGEFVDSLRGDYITAEDVGMSEEIMTTVARKTRYVSRLPLKSGKAGGDPSPKTAWGIFCGIEAAAKAALADEFIGKLDKGYELDADLRDGRVIVLLRAADSGPLTGGSLSADADLEAVRASLAATGEGIGRCRRPLVCRGVRSNRWCKTRWMPAAQRMWFKCKRRWIRSIENIARDMVITTRKTGSCWMWT